MSATVSLKAAARERVGKGAARAERRAGRIPAVIYGGKESATPITLDHKEIALKIKGGHFLTTVFEIDVDGKKVRALPRDFQLDPVKDFPVHVDFLRLTKGATIAVEIPVNFVNEEESPGIKRGGVLNVVRHEIEVNAPADAIPDEIVADLTGLDIGDSLHISAIALPEGVTPTITDRDFTVATVAAPAALKSEEEAAAEEGAEEGAAAEAKAPEGESE
ncbi:50S ribosomal protein L25/general stress protein Ctc [Microbaculum marinisediminis]|uniref:Large ribosomal subunit protein bL25 n=1 Tax=Microbaculum marinisediminis TaxID=2931392 RepID=A0AAW5QZS4_9HYPH|nr:50S ribosomal protein L25/general stress protein Ctc [Microbaculum sp. A6E488]MCT8971941.1 50S ribosomal protein L25/general stress protein Ctc [Microbaculum sp. A6E488]